MGLFVESKSVVRRKKNGTMIINNDRKRRDVNPSTITVMERLDRKMERSLLSKMVEGGRVGWMEGKKLVDRIFKNQIHERDHQNLTKYQGPRHKIPQSLERKTGY